MSRLVNLTGQPLTLYVEDDPITTLPSDGKVWIKTSYSLDEHIYLDVEDGDEVPIPVLVPTEDNVVGLPPPDTDTYYIVTGLVSALMPDRDDLLSPAKIVREGSGGRPLGCRALLRGDREA